MAYHDGRYEDCELFYEEATLADPENGWLYDRYAYVLFSRGRFNEALEKARKATNLIPQDADAWFTRGLFESRIPRTAPTALMTLEKARSLGKAAHSCLLQKAYAYQNLTPADKANARTCLDRADQEVSGGDPYYWKFASEARRLRQRLA